MIDVHCHMLPGIDDGAPDLPTALAMGRLAVSDGISCVACTPHIYPGLYENRADNIRTAVDAFRVQLMEVEIPLQLTYGADIQLVPSLPEALRSGVYPTLSGSRYFLFEPPHHVVPTHLIEVLFAVLAGGYIPVITHPERLTWLDEEHYGRLQAAVYQGAWIQVTAGALVGRFGKRPQYWAERLLDEGLVHILATDAHDTDRRAPRLAEGRGAAARWVGAAEADRLVLERPRAILEDLPPDAVQAPPALLTGAQKPSRMQARPNWWRRLLTRR